MSTRHSELDSESINVYLSRKGRTLREEWIDSGSKSGMTQNCHCEERSDEAIQETKFSVGKINTKTELLTFGLPRFARNDKGEKSSLARLCRAKQLSIVLREVDLGGYQQNKNVEIETHPRPLPNYGGEKRVAFTLAEVLITLAIIGVVATMTIPTLIAEYQQKSWDTATSVFNRRLGEALKIMNANGSLAGYNSTEDFVTELSKHIKIVKTCDNTNLTDCFVSEISTGQDSVKTEDIKKSKNLYSTEDYDTKTMGVMFADGTSALIAYNPNTPYDPYSNKIVSVNGDGKSASLDTEAISILYDVNGLKSPNEYGTGKDIKGLNIKLKVIPKVCANGICVANLGTDYKAIDCSEAGASSEDYKYCTYGDKSFAFTYNYWAGAKKACAEIGMSLPEIGSYSTSKLSCNSYAAENTLCGLYNNREALGLPSSSTFWSASEYSTKAAESVEDFSNGFVRNGHKGTHRSVVCVGN